MANITTRTGKGSALTHSELDDNFSSLNTDKAELSGADFSGNVSVDGNVSVTGTVDGRDIAADGTKLDGVEAGADVTDTANVVGSLTAGTNITIAANGTITATNTNTQLTNEEVQDIIGAMLSGNTETGITVSYQDADGTIDFVVDTQTDENFTTALKNKLDAIESGATADQTAAEIRALVESASDSNVFTDADHTKLDGIEASADVTDTANVVASLTAGANITIAADGTIASTSADTYELDISADTGTGSITDAETLVVFGGPGIGTSITNNTLAISADTATATTKGIASFDSGDFNISGGSVSLASSGGAVDSVNTQTGVVVLDADDISDTSTTNKYTTASDISKLSGIEAGADVTDTANVTAAGALMDSEVTNLDQVKAFDETDYATAAQGTTADAALPRSGGAMTGPITTNSTFDGRDVATDGAKLDGIEAGATTDQTASEIRTLVESATNSNVFTDADHTKLDGIEASADVTDAANVTAAGAVMDSELTSEASVKALNQGVATTDSPSFAGLTIDTNTLKVDSTNNRVGILNAAPDVTLDVGSATDAVHVPVGTTAQRPSSPAAGYLRYNSTTGEFEGYTTAWAALGSDPGASNISHQDEVGTGTQTSFTLENSAAAKNNTQIYIDGVYQNKTSYSLTGGAIVFSEAPPDLSEIDIITIDPTTINEPADGSVTSAKLSGNLTTPGNLDVTGVITTDGMTTSADINFGDNDKAVFGAGNDLSIFHDGSSSIIRDSGTGNLAIQAEDFAVQSADASATHIFVDASSGYTALNYGGSTKLNTSSTGIDVTGDISVTDATPSLNLYDSDNSTRTSLINNTGISFITAYGIASGTYGAFILSSSDHTTSKEIIRADNTNIQFKTDGTLRGRFLSNGDYALYNDAGTSTDFYWDASASRLGLGAGATTPSSTLDVGGELIVTGGGSGTILVNDEDSSLCPTMTFTRNGGGTTTNDFIKFENSGGEVAAINSAGGAYFLNNVGIGTSSLSAGRLTLSGADGANSAGIYFNNTATNGKSYSLSSGNSGEFMLYDRTSSAYRLFVNSAGNVGIGNPSPYRKLTVSGDQVVEGLLEVTAATPQILFSVPSGGLDSRIHNDGSGNFIFGTGTNSATPTERMRITSAGIDVTGTAVTDGLTSSGNILLEASGNPSITNKTTGAGNNPKFRLQANTNYWDIEGIFSNSTDDLFFGYNGSTKLSISNAGNVDVAGNLTVDSGSNGKIDFGDITTNYGRLYADSTGTFVGSVTADPLIFRTTNTERMSITSTGAINVHGDSINQQTSASWNLRNRVAGGSVNLGVETSGGALYYPITLSGASNITIFRNATTELARFTSNGYFGIGTPSPSDPLTIGDGDVGSMGLGIKSTNTGNNYIHFGDTDSASSGRILYDHNADNMQFNTGGTMRGFYSSAGLTITANNGSTSHLFNYNENGGEIQLYDNAGQVGTLIDQSNNATRFLELQNGSIMQIGHGGTNTTGVIQFRSAGFGLAGVIDANANWTFNTNNTSGTAGAGVKITRPNTSGNDDGKLMIVGESSNSVQDAFQIYSTGASAYRFFINYAGSVYATSTSITAISDQSLKENIRDLDKGLNTVLALQPRRFDWRNGDGNDIMGFVAQEVEEVMPELVHDYQYSKTETKLGLKMGDMVPTLVKAIQDQQEIIENLKSRIEQLEGSN